MKNKSKDQEERILIAAQKRFAQYGYSKVTMDEIAADIEMGKASLYYYYPTKEKLFQKVLESEQDEFLKEIEHLLAKDIQASQKLTGYIDIRHRYFEKFINLGTLHLHSAMDSQSLYQNFFKSFTEMELSLIEKIIHEGVEKKEFRKELLKDLPRLILHIQQGFRFLFLKKNQEGKGNKSLLGNLKKDMQMLIELLLIGIKN
jgi:TetR/AcrR family transcriptional regulator